MFVQFVKPIHHHSSQCTMNKHPQTFHLGLVSFGQLFCRMTRIRGRSEVRKAPNKLAQKLGQLQPPIAVLPQRCVGQLASSGPTYHLSRLIQYDGNRRGRGRVAGPRRSCRWNTAVHPIPGGDPGTEARPTCEALWGMARLNKFLFLFRSRPPVGPHRLVV
jgi:hypothetical protein